MDSIITSLIMSVTKITCGNLMPSKFVISDVYIVLLYKPISCLIDCGLNLMMMGVDN